MSVTSVEHDEFFDALEELPSEADSASDDSDHDHGCTLNEKRVGNNALNSSHYEFWNRNPKSIGERRDDFLRMTGFVLDRCQTAREGPDDDDISCVNPTRKCDGRTRETNVHGEQKNMTAVQSYYESDNEGHQGLAAGQNDGVTIDRDQDLSSSTQCWDESKDFDMEEVDNQRMLRQLHEAGLNSCATINEYKCTFGSSDFVKHFIKPESEEENVTVLKRKLQGNKSWLKRFSVRAANMFNKDKDNKEVFQECISFGSRNQRVRVHSHKKWSKELSSLYRMQEFSAHKGSILAMKFSLDGQYLATGGEDGILNVWKVIEDERSTDIDLLSFRSMSGSLDFSVNGTPNLACFLKFKEDGSVMKKLKKSSVSDGIMIPQKVFRIIEKPLHEFLGHEGEILDISWSNKGHLLSSSVDKTTRLWKVGRRRCLKVFPHNDFVTCAQFNPMNNRFFISGSIDGIVRLWNVRRCQVVDWIDIKEIVTAICYQPDGKGGIAGSMVGNCCFFDIADDFSGRVSVIYLQDKRALTCKRITGFQFSPKDPSEVVVSSADSLIRVLKGADITCKLRGSLPLIDHGSQALASFTADGKHIISATNDSNVYVWNHSNGRIRNGKPKSIWSSESFSSHDALIALPWHGITSKSAPTPSSAAKQLSFPRHNQEYQVSSDHPTVNHEKVSSTIEDTDHEFWKNVYEGALSGSHMWGLVIVTAGKDGRIRTFHNYGLPVRYPTKKAIKSSLSFSNIRNRCRDKCNSLRGSVSSSTSPNR